MDTPGTAAVILVRWRASGLAGFKLESRHADWTGAEFTAEARSHVSVYRTGAA